MRHRERGDEGVGWVRAARTYGCQNNMWRVVCGPTEKESPMFLSRGIWADCGPTGVCQSLGRSKHVKAKPEVDAHRTSLKLWLMLVSAAILAEYLIVWPLPCLFTLSIEALMRNYRELRNNW